MARIGAGDTAGDTTEEADPTNDAGSDTSVEDKQTSVIDEGDSNTDTGSSTGGTSTPDPSQPARGRGDPGSDTGSTVPSPTDDAGSDTSAEDRGDDIVDKGNQNTRSGAGKSPTDDAGANTGARQKREQIAETGDRDTDPTPIPRGADQFDAGADTSAADKRAQLQDGLAAGDDPGSQDGEVMVPVDGGVEGQGYETKNEQAAEFESEWLANNPKFNEKDVAVERDGDTLELRFTKSGSAVAVAEQIRNRPTTRPGDVRVENGSVFVDVTWPGEVTESQQMDEVAGKMNRARAKQLADIDFSYTDESVAKANRKLSRRRYNVRQGRQEQLGDYDINIPGTDLTLEDVGRSAGESYSRFAGNVGRAVSGGAGAYYMALLQGDDVSTPDELESVMEDADRTRSAEALGDFTTGAVAVGNVPQVGVSAIEAGEWGVYVGSEAASGGGGAAVGKSWEVGKQRAGAFADYAKQNRAEVAGMGAGALVGSAAIMGTASRVSSRAGAVSRYAIQPGEEVAGKLGNVGTRALAGERTAERLFPNNEPLIFSEEAAIRTAGALGERARRVRTSDSFGYTPAEQRFTSGGVEASGPRIGPSLASEYDQSIEGMVWEGGSRVRDVGRPEQRTLYAGERGDLFTERNPLGTPMEGERELADRIQETYQRARYPRRGVEGYDSAEGQFDPTQADDVDAVWVEGDVDEAAMPDVTDPENIQPFEGSKVATTPTSKIDTGSNRVRTATESEVETQETGVAVEQTRPDAYESPGRLYETNLPGLGQETAVGEGLSSRGRGESLLNAAQGQQARTGLGSESLEFELGRELTAEFERSGLELNTEQETRAEAEGAYENALEMELEQELELEQKIESEAESRIEFESDSMTSNTGRLKGEFGGVGPQDTLLGDDFLSSGWLSESTADVATQATRQAGTPSQDVLEARPFGERLSGELPTKLELTGSQETKKDIAAVRDLFSFGGGQ